MDSTQTMQIMDKSQRSSSNFVELPYINLHGTGTSLGKKIPLVNKTDFSKFDIDKKSNSLEEGDEIRVSRVSPFRASLHDSDTNYGYKVRHSYHTQLNEDLSEQMTGRINPKQESPAATGVMLLTNGQNEVSTVNIKTTAPISQEFPTGRVQEEET